jgi:hypothetical protein
MPERVFGHIPGYPEGSRFESRAESSEAGVHRPLIAGISGSEREGADSIVLSGGYEDDEDLGDEVVYTGHGGRDAESGKQVAQQCLRRENLALAHSSIEGLPIRVVRGASLDSIYAPRGRYRYDGLYMVDDYWQTEGRSGFRVWFYRLIKLPSIPTRVDVTSEGIVALLRPQTLGDDGATSRPRHGTRATDQGPLQLPVPDMRHALGESGRSLRGGGTYPPARCAAPRTGYSGQHTLPVP